MLCATKGEVLGLTELRSARVVQKPCDPSQITAEVH